MVRPRRRWKDNKLVTEKQIVLLGCNLFEGVREHARIFADQVDRITETRNICKIFVRKRI
jgi:hypothetical protein